jgi:hypothetical protein
MNLVVLNSWRAMTADQIQNHIRGYAGWYGVYVKEFTYNSLRVDAVIIDTYKRWIRGFEIKVSRADFLRDHKWELYTEFCSSLTMVCPEGLIKPEEIRKPFGLMYVTEEGKNRYVKKPIKFQQRGSLAWLYTYTKVLEKELPRLQHENNLLRKVGS